MHRADRGEDRRAPKPWNEIITSFQTSFPDKTFNVAIIPIDTGQGQYPFPEIDENGCVFSPPVQSNPPTYSCLNTGTLEQQDNQLNKVLFDLLGLASQKFPGHLVIEFENLETNRDASPTVVEAAEEFSAMTGFMMCSKGTFIALAAGSPVHSASSVVRGIPYHSSNP